MKEVGILESKRSNIITGISLYPIRTPRMSGDYSQHVLLRLDTDSGIYGVGEYADITDLPLTMPDLEDLQKSLVNVLAGQNAMELVRLDFLLGQLFTGRGETGIYTGSLRAGIEMALHDIAGKTLGLPVYALWGGPVRTRIQICFPIFRNLKEQHIEQNLQIVNRLLEKGVDNFRIYIGGNPEMDERFLEALRSQVADRITMQAFDLSGHVQATEAVRLINRMRKYYEPQYVESVAHIHDYRGMAEVRLKLDIPVSEHIANGRQALALWQAAAVDIVNVSNSAHGGMRESLKMFALADTLGLRTILSTTQETSLGTAAEAHVGAAVVNLHYPTVAVGPILYTEDPARNKIQYDNGYMLIPDGPGLGIELDWGKVDELKYKIGWRDYEIDHAVPDIHDRAWKVDLSTGLQGMRKR
jgi:galactarate dehydratase (D-threo-forming)